MRKEIPILFSTAMVQALLAGRKTMTRRVVKGNPNQVVWNPIVVNGYAGYCDEHGRPVKCPYGNPGEVLYVRESWRVHNWCPDDGEMGVSFITDDKTVVTCYDLHEDVFNRLWEQSCMDLADAGVVPDEHTEAYTDGYDPKLLRVRPSIHMPKEAARIWLEVVNVRVDKLKNISAEDAIAEGIIKSDNHYPQQIFAALWQSFNGPDTWDANPWVWVVEFKVLSTDGRPEGI